MPGWEIDRGFRRSDREPVAGERNTGRRGAVGTSDGNSGYEKGGRRIMRSTMLTAGRLWKRDWKGLGLWGVGGECRA